MNTSSDEMTEFEYQQQRVKRLDRKARKLRKKIERRAALLDESDLDGARRAAEKRLRRLARKQRQAFRDLGDAAIAALRD